MTLEFSINIQNRPILYVSIYTFLLYTYFAGEFGIVYRALLKTKNDEDIVAVKTLKGIERMQR